MSDMKRRMLAGEPYLADDPEIAADHARCAALTERYNATGADEPAVRAALLDELFAGVGAGTSIRPPLHVDFGANTTIGSRCFVNFGAVILDVGRVAIGDDVQIGPYVQLLTATHPLEAAPRRAGWEGQRPITIGDGVWLGGGVIVCPGVTIGENAVIGAGAVVTRDIPAGVLALGTPARVVRELPAGVQQHPS